MPRLVLWPTAAMVAATLALMRSPTEAPASSERMRRDPRACLEVGRRSCAWSSPKRCTLPGFSASSSARQASRKAWATCVAVSEPRHAPSWPRGRLACRRTEASVEEGRDDGIGDARARDPLQPLPGRHAVHLEHERRPVAVLDDVDAGIVGADASGGAKSKIGKLFARGSPTSARAPCLMLVIQLDPCLIMAATTLAGGDENPPVAIARRRPEA